MKFTLLRFLVLAVSVLVARITEMDAGRQCRQPEIDEWQAVAAKFEDIAERNEATAMVAIEMAGGWKRSYERERAEHMEDLNRGSGPVVLIPTTGTPR